MNSVEMIEQLKSMILGATRVPGLKNRGMVDLDSLMDIVDELEKNLPVEIQESNEILKQKDSIVKSAMMEASRMRDEVQKEMNIQKVDAQKEVDAMMLKANDEYELKISHSEVMAEATKRAEELSQETQNDCSQLKLDAENDSKRIIEDAQKKEKQILMTADKSSKEKKDGADQYAREILFHLEDKLSSQLNQIRLGIDSLTEIKEIKIS
tara:strand:- start:230 stop:859 length:630 start_codon:yes stop_codon:yes gene_type:complete